MKVLFINSVLGYGSTGKILKDLATMDGVDPYILYGRKDNYTNLENVYKTTNIIGNAVSVAETFLFNKQGFTNRRETIIAIRKIKEFNPDIIHLHCLHGYYINFELLLKEINKLNIPVVWTLHDCWPYTGYCCYYDLENCYKWKTECNGCRARFSYPFSLLKQNTARNFKRKKEVIENMNNITFVTPSEWLAEEAKQSFITKEIITINNGINLSSFKNTERKSKKFTILFVAGVWTKTKGVEEIVKIIPLVNKEIEIIIVGNLVKYRKDFEKRCVLINHTSNIDELAKIYSKSHLLVNPTLEENFPTVNIESLACGTPVVTYRTGGSPEIIDNKTGVVVDKNDYKGIANVINQLKDNYYIDSNDCIERAKMYSKENMLNNYKKLYARLLSNKIE